jgi:uncharacterized protein YjbI with pentapeptide repeats
LRETDLKGARAAGASFAGAFLDGGNASSLYAVCASFAGARIERVAFDKADLRGADFARSRCQKVTFVEADLAGAKVDGAGGMDLGAEKPQQRQAGMPAVPLGCLREPLGDVLGRDRVEEDVSDADQAIRAGSVRPRSACRGGSPPSSRRAWPSLGAAVALVGLPHAKSFPHEPAVPTS